MKRFEVILNDGAKYDFSYNAFSWTFDSQLLEVWEITNRRNVLIVNLSAFNRLWVYDDEQKTSEEMGIS